MYIDDCVDGTQRIIESDYAQPLNLGSSELVTIDQVVDIVERIAGSKKLERHYQLDAPNGVRGWNSDNTLINQVLGWEPSISLETGLEKTYRWIHDQLVAGIKVPRSSSPLQAFRPAWIEMGFLIAFWAFALRSMPAPIPVAATLPRGRGPLAPRVPG